MAAAQSHRRRVMVFVVAVLLTASVLVGLGIRLILQEREIRESRMAEERRAAVSRGRRIVISRLEELEGRVLRDLEEGHAFPSRRYRDSEVRFVARVEDGRIVFPWDDDGALIEARDALLDPTFTAQIRAAERNERDGDLAAARRRYGGDIIREAGSEPQRALARLLLARSLAAGTRSPEAERAYRDVWETPASIVDEYGVPFALYGAARLREWGVEDEAVTGRLRSEMLSSSWRSPTATYLLRDVFAERGIVPREVDEALSALEAALAVERAFPLLLATRRSSEGREAESGWIGLGPGDWLVRAAGPRGSEPKAVVAVSAEALAARLTEDGNLRAGPAGFEIRPVNAGDGIPLGVASPDLGVVFLASVDDVLAQDSDQREAFLVVAVALLIGITLFGGYLLLNDVRREMTLAGLRSDFVSSVSHEVKTPLTSIRMFAETLRSRVNPDPAVTAEYLDTIVGESERLTKLLDNVLDLSKIEEGQKVYVFEPASLAEIVRRAARAVEYSFAAEGFRLELDLDETLAPASVDADALGQAVLNLLTNAMKYSGDARDVELSLRRVGGEAVIAVRDRGIGVPPDEQARLTEKFYRVRSSENEGVPGTGLGLTIVQHMAAAHGGRVSVESAVGEGSTFSIHLPLGARS